MNSQHEELYAKLAEAERLIWEVWGAHCALQKELYEIIKMIVAEDADGE